MRVYQLQVMNFELGREYNVVQEFLFLDKFDAIQEMKILGGKPERFIRKRTRMMRGDYTEIYDFKHWSMKDWTVSFRIKKKEVL